MKSKSFLLLGARGTGKTWLLEEGFRPKAALWLNLLLDRDFLKYQSRPGFLREELVALWAHKNRAPTSEKSWVIIDEVQRVPQLLNEVHALMEEPGLGEAFLFGLSGSSARKLKRGGANLLAGRALLNHLYPLTAFEVGEAFNLTEALNWGMLPAVVSECDALVKSELLQTYVAVYLREEIREEQVVRSLDPFTRFLEVAAQSSGKILNYSSVGRDCQVDSRAIARYFQILEETLLGTMLPAYDKSVRKQQGQSPKFYLFDLGVLRALERTLSIPVTPGSYGYGRLFEHFVIQQFIAANEYSRKRHKLSYLITKDGAEIDLIVERPGLTTLLIEIKSSETPHLSDARHLISLQPSFASSESWVVSQISNERVENGVRFLPWQTAVSEVFSL